MLGISQSVQLISCEKKQSQSLPDLGFHLHNRYEIYLYLSGGAHYFVEQKKYVLERGDMLIFNSREIHKPTFPSPAGIYERYVVHFDPAVAAPYSTPGFSLIGCFENRTRGEKNLLRLGQKELSRFLALFDGMISLRDEAAPGWEILFLSRFLELLVQIGTAYGTHSPSQQEAGYALEPPLSEVVAYINAHLQEDLRLEVLEKRFFINKNYLCKLFRQQTGNTIHSYIQHKRLVRSQELLLEGCSVTEACHLAGFNDYSNFIRLFKRMTGQSPTRFRGGAVYEAQPTQEQQASSLPDFYEC
ncbi:MAG: AraC family transcriptional regulator [Provencibacterium sp.]|nr:AraC family transcriptional regulator [Provencibacterium sp.]